MKKAYDFSKGRRGTVLPPTGKTRITAWLDDDVIEGFKALSAKTGKGYQTLINEALRGWLALDRSPLTVEALRRVLREELAARDLAENAEDLAALNVRESEPAVPFETTHREPKRRGRK